VREAIPARGGVMSRPAAFRSAVDGSCLVPPFRFSARRVDDKRGEARRRRRSALERRRRHDTDEASIAGHDVGPLRKPPPRRSWRSARRRAAHCGNL